MINVIGLGYIGLPTSLILAANNNEVVGTDYNMELVSKLNRKELTFEENGLENLFNQAISKDIKFTNEYIASDVYIVTVPTPYDKLNKKLILPML